MIVTLDLEAIKARLAYADAAIERGSPRDVPVKILTCDLACLVAFVEQQVTGDRREIHVRMDNEHLD